MSVIKSPVEGDISEIPLIPLAELLFSKLEANLEKWQDRYWMVDVNSGTSVTFRDAYEKSKKVAHVMSRLGFKQGDVLYYVTYEMAQLFVVHLATWLLGGAVRGCYQGESPEVFERQIRESESRLIVVDSDTAPAVKRAIESLDWEVRLFYVGRVPVEDALGFEIISCDDDDSAMPECLEIDPKEEVVAIPSTSGSTGAPKGVLHTHYSAVAQIVMFSKIDYMKEGTRSMALMTNFAIGNFLLVMNALYLGATAYNIGKFSYEVYFDLILQYKPDVLMLYPFVAAWFAKSRQISELDLGFIKKIFIAAWVLDPTTADLLHQKLPKAKLSQLYGMTEAIGISASDLMEDRDTEEVRPLTVIENQGELCVTSGQLLPFVKAKIVDLDTGEILPKGDRGEIVISTPSVMKGYLINGEELVSPSEIESVLSEHPSVQAVGVTGIPDPEVTTLARAYVVSKPGELLTEDEVCAYVAERFPEYKHLHGGVRFIEKLPVNKGGKLDRLKLKEMALQDN